MDIWTACKDAVDPEPLSGELIRVIESQEQIATNTLVDNLDEQALLEAILEVSKPPLPPHTAGSQYLLATPFRYPPLRYGSRFGNRHEPSLLYGAIDLSAALAETAYYRFLFWSGMEEPPPCGRLTTEHTVFGARYAVKLGLRLHKDPFRPFEQRLTNPSSYLDTQQLGQNMRGAGVDAFAYLSARDPDRGINIALFHAGGFSEPGPVWQQPWICDTRDDEVSFYGKEHGAWRFRRAQFLVEGDLPAPSV
jgi:hypothetical protein